MRFRVWFSLLILFMAAASPAAARSRIKDIVSFEGVRENQLVGYGLVVGLNGTGDSLRNAPFTQQSLQSMLERLGVNTRAATNIDTKNVAAVMVTAKPPRLRRHRVCRSTPRFRLWATPRAFWGAPWLVHAL